MNNPIDVIEIADVSFSYEKGIDILQDISLKIKEGDFLGIIGPNGGGKSTLLRLLLGILSPTKGSIRIFGKSPKAMRGQIGYVAQFTSFFRDFPISAKEVVLIGRLGKSPLFRSYTKEDEQVVEDLLHRLGILDLKENPISALSGGQLQRVLIARALASQPKILLLDEPAAGTDPKSEENIFDLLKKLSEDITILIVSHDIGFISHYITRVACVNKKLVCHRTEEITPKLLEELYEGSIRIIPHHRIEER